jgi:hypothetical protein
VARLILESDLRAASRGIRFRNWPLRIS